MTRQERDRYYRRKYGMTLKQVVAMFQRQRGRCAICGWKPRPGRRLYVDHDHKTGRVRGGLCYRCNYRLLGRGLENPLHHARAARYLRSTFDGRTL